MSTPRVTPEATDTYLAKRAVRRANTFRRDPAPAGWVVRDGIRRYEGSVPLDAVYEADQPVEPPTPPRRLGAPGLLDDPGAADQLRSMFERGWSDEQMADFLGFTARTVGRARKTLGLQRKPPPPRITRADIGEARRRRGEGQPWSVIAVSIGCSEKGIRRAVERSLAEMCGTDWGYKKHRIYKEDACSACRAAHAAAVREQKARQHERETARAAA